MKMKGSEINKLRERERKKERKKREIEGERERRDREREDTKRKFRVKIERYPNPFQILLVWHFNQQGKGGEVKLFLY